MAHLNNRHHHSRTLSRTQFKIADNLLVFFVLSVSHPLLVQLNTRIRSPHSDDCDWPGLVQAVRATVCLLHPWSFPPSLTQSLRITTLARRTLSPTMPTLREMSKTEGLPVLDDLSRSTIDWSRSDALLRPSYLSCYSRPGDIRSENLESLN